MLHITDLVEKLIASLIKKFERDEIFPYCCFDSSIRFTSDSSFFASNIYNLANELIMNIDCTCVPLSAAFT